MLSSSCGSEIENLSVNRAWCTRLDGYATEMRHQVQLSLAIEELERARPRPLLLSTQQCVQMIIIVQQNKANQERCRGLLTRLSSCSS